MRSEIRPEERGRASDDGGVWVRSGERFPICVRSSLLLCVSVTLWWIEEHSLA